MRVTCLPTFSHRCEPRLLNRSEVCSKDLFGLLDLQPAVPPFRTYTKSKKNSQGHETFLIIACENKFWKLWNKKLTSRYWFHRVVRTETHLFNPPSDNTMSQQYTLLSCLGGTFLTYKVNIISIWYIYEMKFIPVF